MPRDIKIDAKAIGRLVVADQVTIHGDAARTASASQDLKILFLAANPNTTSQLALDKEIRTLTEQIHLADQGRIEVVSAWALRPRDLLQHLNRHRPQIVHFSGHGTTAGELVFVDDDGHERPVSVAAIEAVFSAVANDTRLVFLNSCYSQVQGTAVNRFVDYVVAMDDRVEDAAAIAFAAQFYSAIAFGRPIQESFDQARAAMLLEDIPMTAVPRLLVKQGRSAGRGLW